LAYQLKNFFGIDGRFCCGTRFSASAIRLGSPETTV